jgi:hypothetical protein
MVATLAARNAKDMVGFGRSMKSGSRFCVGAFGRNLSSVAVKMFSYLIYFIRKCYVFFTFNVI